MRYSIDMAIIGSIYSKNNNEIIKMYTSFATTRQNSFRIHYHPTLELCFCISGSGSYKTKKNFYSFSENDFFLFRANELHCITDITSQEGMKLINLHISPDFLLNNSTLEPFLGCFLLSSKLKTHKMNDLFPSSEYLSMINSIRNEFTTKSIGYEEVIKNLVVNILIYIGRTLQAEQTTSKNRTSRNLYFLKNILQEIELNYTENLTLEEISKKLNYHKNYLSALFKNTFGTTLWEYILIKRIDKALDLIRNSDLPITEIYLQCGFNNSANFNKQFKKYTGKLPREFR